MRHVRMLHLRLTHRGRRADLTRLGILGLSSSSRRIRSRTANGPPGSRHGVLMTGRREAALCGIWDGGRHTSDSICGILDPEDLRPVDGISLGEPQLIGASPCRLWLPALNKMEAWGQLRLHRAGKKVLETMGVIGVVSSIAELVRRYWSVEYGENMIKRTQAPTPCG